MKSRVKMLMNHILYDVNLNTKILLSYFALIILPLGLLSIITYNRVNVIVQKQVMFSSHQAFDQTISFLSYKFYKILKVSDILSTDGFIRETLEKKAPNYPIYQQISDFDKLTQYLSSFYDREDVQRVRLYIPDEFMYNNEHKNLYALRDAQNENWYPQIHQSDRKVEWLAYQPYDDNTELPDKMLTVARSIWNSKNYSETIGYLLVDFSEENIRKTLSKSNTVKNSLTFLQNSRGNLITASDENLYHRYSSAIRLLTHVPDQLNRQSLTLEDGEKVYSSSILIPNTDWYLVTVIPMNEIISESAKLSSFVFILMLVLGTLAYILAYFISGSLTKRVTHLKNHINDVQKGILQPIGGNTSKDEIGQLIDDFNYMVGRISSLLDEQYRMGQELKNAELKALQAQINPHFLYNSLELINWLAPNQMVEETRNVVKSLATFYKLSLSKGKDIISIREEVQLTTSYMQIQSMRFYNRLKYQLTVDDEVNDLSIPKITIQPLVENAVLHGILTKKAQQGTIHIEIRLEKDFVVIEVHDDGTGIPEEKLASILANKGTDKTGSSYGISNINARLKLFFGKQYGVILHSKYGQGTTAEIRIPAIPYE